MTTAEILTEISLTTTTISMVAMTTMIILMTEMDTRDILIPTEEIPRGTNSPLPGPEITIFKGFRSPTGSSSYFLQDTEV